MRLPLSGKTLQDLRQHCLYWYVTPVCYLALSLEPEARSIYFAVARFRDDSHEPARESLSHRFVLSTDESPRWPHALCASSNPLLDGRSDRAVAAAHEQLYGSSAVDIGASDGALLAWSAYCKPDRRPSDPAPNTYAPVFSMARRERVANEYIRGPFPVTATMCGIVWQPELLHGRVVPPNAYSPSATLPAGMGATELARLAAHARELSPTPAWDRAFEPQLEQLFPIAERLALGTITDNDRTYLRGPQIDAALRAVQTLLEDT